MIQSKEKNRAVTIHDIATKAGVSITTVSRVVNGNKNVSKKTKKKVQQIIDEMGYVPNETARSLVMQTSKTIGLLIPDILNTYYAEFIKYLEPIITDRGYSLQLCITNAENEKNRYYIEDLIRRRAVGVIILSLKIDDEELIHKMKANMAVVAVEADIEDIDSICVESRQGIYNTVKYLIAAGHRKIGFVGYSYNLQTLNIRLDGYKMALDDAGIEYREEYVLDMQGSKNPGYDATLHLLELEDPPTAIQSMNEYCAQGIYMALMEKGIKIPEEMSVAAFDGLAASRLMVPRLTTSLLPLTSMVEEAAGMLLQNIENGTSQVVRRMTLPVRLYEGESVKKIK